jgi:hypothetical protein
MFNFVEWEHIHFGMNMTAWFGAMYIELSTNTPFKNSLHC